VGGSVVRAEQNWTPKHREGEGEAARQTMGKEEAPKQARAWQGALYNGAAAGVSRRPPRGSGRHVETRWIRLKNCDGAGPYPLSGFPLPPLHSPLSLVFWQACPSPDMAARSAPPARKG
jgi:hypothetical protein